MMTVFHSSPPAEGTVEESRESPVATTKTNRSLRAQKTPRIKACAECKKSKIRCESRRGQVACSRCLRRGLDCLPHDPISVRLENTERWKAQAKTEIAQLQAAVNELLQRRHIDGSPSSQAEPKPSNITTSPTNSTQGAGSATDSVIAPMDISHHSADDRRTDPPGLVQAPMSNLYELAGASKPQPLPTHAQNASMSRLDQDLISQGIISLEQAERLFTRWLQGHHPLLWGGINFPYTTLEATRQASPLLSTAILTIAALHTPGKSGRENELQKCYDTFVSLVSESGLSKHYGLDDIRALCFAAFFLPNLSWRLSGLAVRMAAEMNIHQSFNRLMNGDARHGERVRLWYALYVSDTHISTAYGRPPAMHDDAAIRGVERFIQAPSSMPGDIRISAQVALFRILSDAYREYGSDQTQPLTREEVDKLRSFNIAVEQWRLQWEPQHLDAPTVRSYPSKGLILYYHFARFQLSSLALRGVRFPSVEPLWPSRREAAMDAISAATSTLVHMLNEEDIRQSLVFLPIYTHTMVAFCATFLLKIAAAWTRAGGGGGGDSLSYALGLGFNYPEVISLARRSADMLSDVSRQLDEKHMSRLIVAGIREMLQRVEAGANSGTPAHNGPPVRSINLGNGQPMTTGTDNGVAMDTPMMGNSAAVDFVTEQMGDSGQGMIYNMDLDSLAGLLEYDSDHHFLDELSGNTFTSWDQAI